MMMMMTTMMIAYLPALPIAREPLHIASKCRHTANLRTTSSGRRLVFVQLAAHPRRRTAGSKFKVAVKVIWIQLMRVRRAMAIGLRPRPGSQTIHGCAPVPCTRWLIELMNNPLSQDHSIGSCCCIPYGFQRNGLSA